MCLVGGDVVDAGMVVPGVVPGKVSIEVGGGLGVIQELAGIFGSPFYGAEGELDEGVVVGGSRAGEHLGHGVILAEPLDGLGFHLAAAVVDEFGALALGQVEDVLVDEAAFEQEPGLLGGLLLV